MAASCDLNVAKRNLSDALGDSMKIYLGNLKAWFKQKMTKEEFDLESRRLLKEEFAHLHNDFLLAIFTKCGSLSSSMAPKDITNSPQYLSAGKCPKRKDLKSRRKEPSSRSSFPRFAPVNPLLYAPPALTRDEETSLGFCSRELTLPDASLIHGRMFVNAWESELEGVTDDSVKMVMLAVEHHLKNILTVVLSRRNAYKLREGRFKFGMGGEVSNPYLRQSALTDDTSTQSEATSITTSGYHIPTIRPSTDLGEASAAKQISLAVDMPRTRGPVTLFDLLEALQLHKDSIPSHTVYATNIERIIHKLWHPSKEELEQDLIHQQEMMYKQQNNSLHHHLPIRL
ncbi:transcriptional adapter 1-like isoform X2 [Liolophura sinensis]|uniref:transcriptional adapter 1-like isoform X2 n=1 Tax=Liolophura sinensis TaxID=3198878 RepID=UPI00315966FD